MNKLIAVLALAGVVRAASADDSHLYWMVDEADKTAEAIVYDTVQVRAFETGSGADAGYLNLYYGNGAEVGGVSVSKADATSGLSLYASLAASAGSSFSYVVELFNDGAIVGQSEALAFTEAMTQNYVATVTSTGTLPAMASWAAGSFSAVPEPTSGLLLLLGGLTLLLRRKPGCVA